MRTIWKANKAYFLSSGVGTCWRLPANGLAVDAGPEAGGELVASTAVGLGVGASVTSGTGGATGGVGSGVGAQVGGDGVGGGKAEESGNATGIGLFAVLGSCDTLVLSKEQASNEEGSIRRSESTKHEAGSEEK